MKKILKKKTKKAFTLLEMLVVLLIIGVLILLFVPNLSKQKKAVERTGNETIVNVIKTQKELYLLEEETTEEPTAEDLKGKGYITEDQLNKYNSVPQEEKDKLEGK